MAPGLDTWDACEGYPPHWQYPIPGSLVAWLARGRMGEVRRGLRRRCAWQGSLTGCAAQLVAGEVGRARARHVHHPPPPGRDGPATAASRAPPLGSTPFSILTATRTCDGAPVLNPFAPWVAFRNSSTTIPVARFVRFQGCRCVQVGPGAVHARGATLTLETFPVARATAVADEVRIVVPELAASQWL